MRFGADSNRICQVEYQDLPVFISHGWVDSSQGHVQARKSLSNQTGCISPIPGAGQLKVSGN
jgi:hypothetical protein